ncbi:FUSC family protein [uncultured Clostridium sp.]|uniref:FUSC family protein n=2 Tax=uncultured Clostridium sp. TaxID=59620 RepID=UPI00263A9C01|nr:FUSC family protein [uncultured Clostridium sp.]
MMKNKIIANTINYLAILLFVNVFAAIFGRGNTLIGVTIVVAISILKMEDMTKNFYSNLLKLLFINLISGVFAHLSSHNVYLGLILNFSILLIMGYTLTSQLNKIKLLPFGLQYLFMLYAPVSGNDFVKRLLGLATGAFLVMLVQLITYRKSKKLEEPKCQSNTINKENDYILLFNKFNIHNVRGAYAFRVALIITISVFLVDFFKLAQGRWIIYTVFALTELYSENCRIRSKQRFQGTVVGVIIMMILFIFIRDNSIRGLMALIPGYLGSYATNYRDNILCVTMSVVASVSLINGTFTTGIERVAYICVGIVIAIIADKIILNKKIECVNNV